MSAYLGVTGQLIKIPCASQERIPEARPMGVKTTLGGRRVAVLGKAQKRSWDVSIGTERPAGIGTLRAILASLPMPYVWYSDWACATNILTPDDTAWLGLTLAGATPGALVELDGGGYAASMNDPAPAGGSRQFTVGRPVVPGVKVTAGIHARPVAVGGSVTLRLTWRNAAGSAISSVSASKVCASSGPLTRVTVSAVPPSGAVDAYMVVSGHSAFAGPSLTFTDAGVDYSPGNGCLTAVIDGADVAPIMAWGQPGGQRASLSFTVTEVG